MLKYLDPGHPLLALFRVAQQTYPKSKPSPLRNFWIKHYLSRFGEFHGIGKPDIQGFT